MDSGLKFTIDGRSIYLIIDEDLNQPLGTGFAFLRPRWIVTAKHVVVDQGLPRSNLTALPFRKDSGIALLGFNSAGQPWITWATGPNGDKSYGAAKIPGKQDENQSKQPQTDQSEPAAFYTKSALSYSKLILFLPLDA